MMEHCQYLHDRSAHQHRGLKKQESTIRRKSACMYVTSRIYNNELIHEQYGICEHHYGTLMNTLMREKVPEKKAPG